MQQFASMKPDNDILVRIIVKKTPGQFAYSAMRNQRTDFPVLTCAVSTFNGTYRAAIGARPGRAVLVSDTAGILADSVTETSAQNFAAYVSEQVPTQSNVRAGSTYRSHLIRVLTARCLMDIASQKQ